MSNYDEIIGYDELATAALGDAVREIECCFSDLRDYLESPSHGTRYELCGKLDDHLDKLSGIANQLPTTEQIVEQIMEDRKRYEELDREQELQRDRGYVRKDRRVGIEDRVRSKNSNEHFNCRFPGLR